LITYPPSLLAVGGARTGIAPVNLLDVQDVNGNIYRWADRSVIAPAISFGTDSVPALPPVTIPSGQCVAWALPRSVAIGGVLGTWGSATANLSSAQLHLMHAASLDQQTPEAYVLWSDFLAQSLPSGAVISAIYPVVLINNWTVLPSSAWVAGGTTINTNDAVHGLDAPGLALCSGAPGAIGEYAATSLGTSLTDLSAAEICAYMWDSPTGDYNDSMSLSFIGLAIYYSMPSGGSSGSSGIPAGSTLYEPWLLTVPDLTFHRSSVTDMGSFVLQNLSGDTVSRDFEKIMRKSALEGAFFVFRCWQADAQAAWIEVHGKLTVSDVGVDTVTLHGEAAINPASDDTPLEEFCETCQLQWGQARCGATGSVECQYSFQTCQVVERIMAAPNFYEKNYGETTANVPTQIINRRRRI
jgi:hypothetical protein